MRLILLGPPGVGKGTQAQNICHIMKYPHISTGDILRDAVKNKTEIGCIANTYMTKGDLVPDEIVIKLVELRIKEKDAEKGFLLDGFPRTVAQAVALDRELETINKPINKVINLVAKEDEIIIRLTGRRTCTVCGKNYHIKYIQPKQVDICDIDGGKLIQRVDDQENTVRNRLKVYKSKTKELIDYYKEKNKLVTIDASQDIQHITNNILENLKTTSSC